MVNGTDVTVTSGNSIVFANALSNGDIVDAVAFGTFSLANMNASNLTSGTVPIARLGTSGTKDATTFLRGDNTFAVVTSVGGATGVDFNDNVKARFGAGNDLEIYHEGNHSFISDEGTGVLALTTNGASIQLNHDGENMILAYADAQVELFHDNSKKFETASTGVIVTGSILPAADDTHDLGSSSKQWRDIYTGDINLNNTKTRDNEVDGTRGSWTIQEGSDDLFLLNRLNGKKYKFKLEEM